MCIEIEIVTFKQNMKTNSPEDIVEDILTRSPKHIDCQQINFIKKNIAECFNVEVSDIQIFIVGSANLGFSISEKRTKDVFKPRFRSFDIDSDIDVAIISDKVFSLIWHSLSSYAFRKSYFPWDSNKLGDYMVSGTLRPDKFPNFYYKKKWGSCFNRLSRSSVLQRRKVSGCLYYSEEMLKNYQMRSVMDCISSEELTI